MTVQGGFAQRQTGVTVLFRSEMSHSSGSQISSYSLVTSANVISHDEYVFKLVTTG